MWLGDVLAPVTSTLFGVWEAIGRLEWEILLMWPQSRTIQFVGSYHSSCSLYKNRLTIAPTSFDQPVLLTAFNRNARFHGNRRQKPEK